MGSASCTVDPRERMPLGLHIVFESDYETLEQIGTERTLWGGVLKACGALSREPWSDADADRTCPLL